MPLEIRDQIKFVGLFPFKSLHFGWGKERFYTILHSSGDDANIFLLIVGRVPTIRFTYHPPKSPFPTWSLADGILAALKSPNPADRWCPLVGKNSVWVGDFNELCITCFICLCWCKCLYIIYMIYVCMQCIPYHMYVKIHLRKYDISFQRCVTFVYVCKKNVWVHNPRSWSPVLTFIQMHMHMFKFTVYTLKSYFCINWK